MEKVKPSDDAQSTPSNTSTNMPVVDSHDEAFTAPAEESKTRMEKRRKTETRTIWNLEKHSQKMQLMQKDLETSLRHCLSGDERDVLNQSLRPPAQFLWYEIITEIKSDLNSSLRANYPSMRLEVYGSALIGIAFKDADVDIFVNLSKSTQNDANQLMDQVTKLLSQSEKFTKMAKLLSVRTPILRLLHVKTGWFVRLNFFDRIGTINSPILAHLLTFDARIDFLLTTIKWWFKVHHCYGPKRITNYAVMWLVIFYLQSVAIVPPIHYFQMHEPEMIINGFNYTFDYNYPNKTRNGQRCAELLLGFFQFYSGFDFEKLVICPLFGRAFAKSDVRAKKLLEFEKYTALLENNPEMKPMNMKVSICIQDPFEITTSIPVHFAPKVFSRVVHKFAIAAEFIERELNRSGESTSLFLRLFDTNLFHQIADAKLSENQY